MKKHLIRLHGQLAPLLCGAILAAACSSASLADERDEVWYLANFFEIRANHCDPFVSPLLLRQTDGGTTLQ